MLPIANILHATDFSLNSKGAFDMACAIARDSGAKITLVHVSPPPMASGEVYAIITDSKEINQELKERLDRMVPPNTFLAFDKVLVEGDPAREILKVAKEHHCDLIVLGTHGRKGINRLLMGSVAEEVVRNAGCPVLTVKHPVAVATTEEEKEPAVAALAFI